MASLQKFHYVTSKIFINFRHPKRAYSFNKALNFLLGYKFKFLP